MMERPTQVVRQEFEEAQRLHEANREQSQTHRIVENMLDEMVIALWDVRLHMKTHRLEGHIDEQYISMYANKLRLVGKLSIDSLNYLGHDTEEHVEFDSEVEEIE
jgi:hypothetical protein